MAYDTKLADKIREYLSAFPLLKLEEKKMFRGMTFIVNGKMCIGVSGENLMCRIDPALHEEVAEKTGYLPMTMKGKVLKGYCYVDPTGVTSKKELTDWIDLCLTYNNAAKAAKRKKKEQPVK